MRGIFLRLAAAGIIGAALGCSPAAGDMYWDAAGSIGIEVLEQCCTLLDEVDPNQVQALSDHFEEAAERLGERRADLVGLRPPESAAAGHRQAISALYELESLYDDLARTADRAACEPDESRASCYPKEVDFLQRFETVTYSWQRNIREVRSAFDDLAAMTGAPLFPETSCGL